MSKITQLAKSETDQPKKRSSGEYIFIHGFGLKIQNTNGWKSLSNLFNIWKIHESVKKVVLNFWQHIAPP